jgi:hypothetical protein
MILPTLLTISAYAKEADGKPLSKAEIEAQADWMVRCKRFMATFSEFAKANGIRPIEQCEASVSRPAKTEEPA